MSIPTPVNAPAELALESLRHGRLDTAAAQVVEALELTPEDPNVLVLASMIASQRKNLSEAEDFLRRALEIDSQHKEGLIILGKLLAATGREAEAIAVAELAVISYPDDADLWGHLGLLSARARAFGEAVKAFSRCLELDPKNVQTKQNLAAALADAGREHEAIESYQDLVRSSPRNIAAWINLARILLMHGRFAEAVEAADNAVNLDRVNQTAHLLKALALAENAQGSEAEPHLRRAVKLNPNDGLAKAALGYWFQEEGRFEESLQVIEEAISLLPNHGFAYYNFFRAKKATEADPEFISGLKERAQQPDLPIRDATYMNYALGKAHEDLKDYEQAIGYYTQGNRRAYEIWLGQRPWEREDYHDRFSRSIEIFDRDKLSELSSGGHDTDLPLIIVGMMRSGTSLLEQILSSHPDVIGAGELPFWHDFENEAYGENGMPEAVKIRALGERYLEQLQKLGPDAKRVTDKLPHNYAMLGLIHTAFPNAKIIHVKRNPIDNCLSIYTTAYQRPPVFAHDRDNIVFAYREYLRIVAHWREVMPKDRFMEIQYEELIEDRENLTRQLIDFSGLPWDDACLHHESNQRAVRTPSLWQVRQQIYKTSVERWRRFEPWIPEFVALGHES